MPSERYTLIETWQEDDLLDIPETETDYYEYKSSVIRNDKQFKNKLKEDICIAASAFWNTGGGIFIAGVGDDGKIDGGIPAQIGRQKIRDWVDQILLDVETLGPYAVNAIEGKNTNTLIDPDHVVLVIGFGESYNLPHMAPDKKHYVRVGAHSLPAGHYLVEALRARRGLNQPMLRGLLRNHQQKPGVLELIVLTANEIPALDVEINLDPIPSVFIEHDADKIFPLRIPIIDQQHSFRMDIAIANALDQWFGEKPIFLELTYSDWAGRKFSDRQIVDPRRGVSSYELELTRSNSPEKTLSQISKDIKLISQFITFRLPQLLSDSDDTGSGEET